MKSDFDPISFVTWLAGLVVGTKFSPVLAPYLIILVMSTAGALYSLGRRDPSAKPRGFAYIFVVNCIAVGCTSLLVRLIANQTDLDAPLLIAPVALVIGAIGLDWDKVLPYLYDKYMAWRRGGQQNG